MAALVHPQSELDKGVTRSGPEDHLSSTRFHTVPVVSQQPCHLLIKVNNSYKGNDSCCFLLVLDIRHPKCPDGRGRYPIYQWKPFYVPCRSRSPFGIRTSNPAWPRVVKTPSIKSPNGSLQMMFSWANPSSCLSS